MAKHSSKIWLDGKYLPWEQARVHVLTHALHYGSSVFEGIRFYETSVGPKVFRLYEHLVRFFDSAKALGLRIPYNKKLLARVILKLVQESGMKNGYVRPLAFYGAGSSGINPIKVPTQVMIAVFPWLRNGKSIKIKVSPFIRIHPKSTRVEAKIGGHYINSIMALQDARKDGFDEVILLDVAGNVAEGAVGNIFIVKRGKVYTPKLGGILPGITRETILELCRSYLQIPAYERNLRLADLMQADEIFFVGTAYEVTLISRLGKKRFTIKPSSTASRIQALYKSVVTGTIPRYRKWLS